MEFPSFWLALGYHLQYSVWYQEAVLHRCLHVTVVEIITLVSAGK